MADGPLSSRVYDDILSRILSGRMKPGDVFNRRQIAAELGVSVAPVLEAMLELESEGLIETLPRRGTRVRLPSPEDVWGQTIVRQAIECQAARLYCGQSIVRHRSRLQRLAEALDGLTVGSIEQIREELRFHHYLVSLANCPPLTMELERVMKLGLLHAVAVLDGDRGQALTHVELLDILAGSDPDTCAAAIRQHIRNIPAPVGVQERAQPDAEPGLPSWLGAAGAS